MNRLDTIFGHKTVHITTCPVVNERAFTAIHTSTFVNTDGDMWISYEVPIRTTQPLPTPFAVQRGKTGNIRPSILRQNITRKHIR